MLLATLLLATTVDVHAAERFANLALACVHKEYPNQIAHVMNSDADVGTPKQLTPAFYGCYDWHSCVHGHWLLARLVRTFPDAPFAARARDALREDITAANIEQEAAYLKAPGRTSHERPYGLAWLLQLGAELREWNDPMAHELAANLHPLEVAVNDRLKTWLPKLSHPVRIGEHDQTAFSLGLIIDSTDDPEMRTIARDAAKRFFLRDKRCPINYEPSGEDFLSPCIAEADVMRRVLPPKEFASWLSGFLPDVRWPKPEVVTDPSDPKLAHLDGLNLSRAWMLEGIASGLPKNDPRIPGILAAAHAHAEAGLAHVTGEHYEGGHWLGSFAVYLTTRRGIHD
ncbi:MAG TPA: DUF2891 domain-containing protein [Thermoanaerobaculia bacterium]|nr:DUF2891 domain-containing protein [Thermoanaerobaculia bacterium]